MADTFSLRNIYLFAHLSDARLSQIAPVLERRTLKKGDVVFNRGDAGDALFLVEQGQLAIFAPDPANPGEEKPIRLFHKEDALGEMALIDHQPRSLSARAEQDSVVLVLKDSDFRRFVSEDADLAFAVMEGLSDRIRYTTDFLGEVRAWVGKVTQGEYQNEAFVSEVQGWVKQIAEGQYDEAMQAPARYRDETLARLAADFAHMAARVKEREDELKREIVQLKIQIDESKRAEEVNRIQQSEFFQSLQAKARQMRQSDSDDQE